MNLACESLDDVKLLQLIMSYAWISCRTHDVTQARTRVFPKCCYGARSRTLYDLRAFSIAITRGLRHNTKLRESIRRFYALWQWRQTSTASCALVRNKKKITYHVVWKLQDTEHQDKSKRSINDRLHVDWVCGLVADLNQGSVEVLRSMFCRLYDLLWILDSK